MRRVDQWKPDEIVFILQQANPRRGWPVLGMFSKRLLGAASRYDFGGYGMRKAA